MEFFIKLLEWPFLLFIGITLLIWKFGDEFKKLISRGGVILTWGDKSFAISELPEQLNMSFAPVTDDIDELKAKVERLEEQLSIKDGQKTNSSNATLTSEQTEAARKRMLEGLERGKYTWRSLERLATIGNVTEEQASSILRPMDEVTFSRGKSGRTIVKLASK